MRMHTIHRSIASKSPGSILWVAVFFLFSQSPVFAQQETAEDMSITVPAKSVEAFFDRLLPYEIDLGKGFSGLFSIRSIHAIDVLSDRIAFSAVVHGENVEFKTTIGKQEAVLTFGNIDLKNRWEVGFRFEPSSRTLYLTPHLIDPKAATPSSQGEMLLTAIFGGLSDMEYPIDLKALPPMITRGGKNTLTIDFEVAGIGTAGNQLIFRIKPIPKAERINPHE